MLAAGLDAPAPLVYFLAIVGFLIAAYFIYLDSRSSIVIGPVQIAYLSPISFLCWSIPTAKVIQADVEQGKPHWRLRFRTVDGKSYTVPVTLELWNAIQQVAGT